MNRYAIFLTISKDYTFAAANLIMGLNKHSADLMQNCDLIIFHEGISEKEQILLSQLHNPVIFEVMEFPQSWNSILQSETAVKWHPIVFCKLFGFFLVRTYEKVLFLDVDMLVRGDISELFEMEEEIAWRPVLYWNVQNAFADMIEPDDTIHVGNAGLYVFTSELRKYHITEQDIVDAFEAIKDLKRGGADELIFAWIVHEKKIRLRELDHTVYNTPVRFGIQSSKIIHFIHYKKVELKPWINPAAYFYFTDWAAYYQRWLRMGGEGPIDFQEEDYLGMFHFEMAENLQSMEKKVRSLEKRNKDKIKQIKKLESDYQQLESDHNSLASDFEQLKSDCSSLESDYKKLESDHKKLKRDHKKLKTGHKKLRAELKAMQDSQFWKITKPLRIICEKLQKLIGK